MPPLNTGDVETMGAVEEPFQSEMEVDYDRNITALYAAITDCEWEKAIEAVKNDPKEAQTWVVRHYENDQDGEEPGEVMWRFLPIHSACARQPPASVISALIKAYPDGPKCPDDQGMYPLHYACGNQASREVIRLLLVAFPQAAKLADPRGMLPIHYLACWGPSSVSIIDMILVANRDVSDAKDADGNSALDLAMEGEYEDKDAVISTLRRWLDKNSARTGPPSFSPRSPLRVDKTLTISTTPVAAERSTLVEKEPSDTTSNTISRLRLDMTKLKTELREADDNKKQAVEEAVAPYRTQVQDLQAELETSKQQVEFQAMQMEKLREEIAALSTYMDQAVELERKEDLLHSTEVKLEEATQTIVSVKKERDELASELGMVEAERNLFKKKGENINDRLLSLSASLASLSDNQFLVNAKIKDREARLVSAAEVRRAKLQALQEFEEQLMAGSAAIDHDGDFEQQKREFDAISAVIAAMKF